MAQTVREASEALLKYINEQWIDDEVRFDGEKLSKFRSAHFQRLLDNLSDAFTEESLDEYPGELIEVKPDPNIERIATSLGRIERILAKQFGFVEVIVPEIVVPDNLDLDGDG